MYTKLLKKKKKESFYFSLGQPLILFLTVKRIIHAKFQKLKKKKKKKKRVLPEVKVLYGKSMGFFGPIYLPSYLVGNCTFTGGQWLGTQ